MDSITCSYLFISAKVRIGVHSTPKYGTKQVTLGIKKVDQENIMFPRYFLSNLRSRHAVLHIPYAYTHQAPATQAIYIAIFFRFFFHIIQDTSMSLTPVSEVFMALYRHVEARALLSSNNVVLSVSICSNW